MSLSTKLFATIRGGPSDGGEIALRSNTSGEQLVAQGFPPNTEMTRKYNRVSAMNTSALAALVVRPSTVASFTIFNPTTSGSDYIMDQIFAFNLVSTAAQAKSGMWYCVHPTGLVSPTADITARGWGRGTAGTDVSVADTAMTVTNDGWFPIGPWSDVEPTGVLPGAIMVAEFNGRVIVPPGCGISGQVVSSVVGNTFTMGFSWYAVPELSKG